MHFQRQEFNIRIMKKIIQYSILIILTGCVSFVSCKKEKTVNSVVTPRLPPPSPPDTLIGREFQYDNLIWQTWGDPYYYIEVPNSGLFLNRGIQVFIDSSSTWINVPFYYVEFGMGTANPFPDNNGYIYDNSYFDFVFLFAIGSNNSQLVGTRVSVKIKVL